MGKKKKSKNSNYKKSANVETVLLTKEENQYGRIDLITYFFLMIILTILLFVAPLTYEPYFTLGVTLLYGAFLLHEFGKEKAYKILGCVGSVVTLVFFVLMMYSWFSTDSENTNTIWHLFIQRFIVNSF